MNIKDTDIAALKAAVSTRLDAIFECVYQDISKVQDWKTGVDVGEFTTLYSLYNDIKSQVGEEGMETLYPTERFDSLLAQINKGMQKPSESVNIDESFMEFLVETFASKDDPYVGDYEDLADDISHVAIDWVEGSGMKGEDLIELEKEVRATRKAFLRQYGKKITGGN